LIKHQNEVAQLKEDFRERLDSQKEAQHKRERELEKEIDGLEKKLYKKEIEYRNGDSSFTGFVKDMAEVVIPMFSGENKPDLSGLIQRQVPIPNPQVTANTSAGLENKVLPNTSSDQLPEPNELKPQQKSDEELSSWYERKLKNETDLVADEN
jgi:hypothetical protein